MSQVKDRLTELSKAITFKGGNYTIQQLGEMKLGHVLRIIQQNGLDLRTEITNYPVPGVSGMADMSDDGNRPVQLVQLESKPDTMIEVIPVEGGYAIGLDDGEHSIQLGPTRADRDEAVKIAKYWADVLHSFYHDPATCKHCSQASQDQVAQSQESQDQGSQAQEEHSHLVKLIATIANMTPADFRAEVDRHQGEGKPLTDLIRKIVISSLLASVSAKTITVSRGAEMMAYYDRMIEESNKHAGIVGSDVDTLFGIWLDAKSDEETFTLSVERILKPQLRKRGVSEESINQYVNERVRKPRDNSIDDLLNVLVAESKNDPTIKAMMKGLFDKGLDVLASRG